MGSSPILRRRMGTSGGLPLSNHALPPLQTRESLPRCPGKLPVVPISNLGHLITNLVLDCVNSPIGGAL
jgi:hypothetical protein